MENWLFERCLNIYFGNFVSLDEPVVIEEGEQVLRGHMLSDFDQEARLTRLKAVILTMTKKKLEKAIIELLFEGHDVKYISQKLKRSQEIVRLTLRDFRKRCRGSKKKLSVKK